MLYPTAFGPGDGAVEDRNAFRKGNAAPGLRDDAKIAAVAVDAWSPASKDTNAMWQLLWLLLHMQCVTLFALDLVPVALTIFALWASYVIASLTLYARWWSATQPRWTWEVQSNQDIEAVNATAFCAASSRRTSTPTETRSGRRLVGFVAGVSELAQGRLVRPFGFRLVDLLMQEYEGSVTLSPDWKLQELGQFIQNFLTVIIASCDSDK